MTLREAAHIARTSAHGCRMHQRAMSILFASHRNSVNTEDGRRVSLAELWAWVDEKLEASKYEGASR